MGSDNSEVLAAIRDLQIQVRDLTLAVNRVAEVIAARHESPVRVAVAGTSVSLVVSCFSGFSLYLSGLQPTGLRDPTYSGFSQVFGFLFASWSYRFWWQGCSCLADWSVGKVCSSRKDQSPETKSTDWLAQYRLRGVAGPWIWHTTGLHKRSWLPTGGRELWPWHFVTRIPIGGRGEDLLCGCWNSLPHNDLSMATMINPTSIEGGFLDYYTLTWPLDTVGQDDAMVAIAVVVMRRQGGLLLGLPIGFIPVEDLQAASDQAEESLLGPHNTFTVPAIREDGQAVLEGQDVEVLVIDAGDAILKGMADYSEIDGASFYFSDDPVLGPSPQVLLQVVSGRRDDTRRGGGTCHTGGASAGGGRDYSSKEKAGGKSRKGKGHNSVTGRADRLYEQPSSIHCFEIGSTSAGAERDEGAVGSSGHCDSTSSQSVAGIYESHSFCKDDGLSPKGEASTSSVSSFGHAVPSSSFLGSSYDPSGAGGGVPCSWRFNLGKSCLGAEQSTDYAGGSATDRWRPIARLASRFLRDFTGIKGRCRERLQAELSNRSGNFFLAVTQNAWRRMKPASRLPTDLNAAAATDFSMVAYLEKFGGYGSCRELGLIQYCLGHIYDCALHADMDGVREHVALTITALEQAAQDNNRWELAYQLTLLEDPPSQLWSYRQTSHNPRLRAFAPLCRQRWATIALAYMKELDYIQNRKTDLVKKPQAAVTSGDPSPKKKGKGNRAKGAQSRRRSRCWAYVLAECFCGWSRCSWWIQVFGEGCCRFLWWWGGFWCVGGWSSQEDSGLSLRLLLFLHEGYHWLQRR